MSECSIMGLDLCSDKGCMKKKYSAIRKEGNMSHKLMLLLGGSIMLPLRIRKSWKAIKPTPILN